MKRSPEARLMSGLILTALISGCTATTELEARQPASAPVNPSIAEIQPTVTPSPPSEPGRKPVFPTPEPRPLSELASLQAELMNPTIKSIEGLSYVKFMTGKGYKIFTGEFLSPQIGIVLGSEESTTRILPDSNAQALPKKYSLKVGSKLSSIKYIVQAVKVGPTAENEPRQVWWIARRAEVALGEGNPPSLMWVFHELKRVYNNGEVIIIELRNPNPQNRPRIL